jgi:hypothetical protein
MQQALPAMVTIVSTIVTVAVPVFIKLAFDRTAAATKNEELKAAIGRLGDASVKAVRDVSATVLPELKKDAADGKITKEEGAQLKDAAVEKVKALLGEVTVTKTAAVLGYTTPEQIAERLKIEIENALAKTKLEKVAVAAAAPVVVVPAK